MTFDTELELYSLFPPSDGLDNIMSPSQIEASNAENERYWANKVVHSKHKQVVEPPPEPELVITFEDFVSDTSTFDITGTVSVPSSTITVEIDGTPLFTFADANGNWSVTVGSPLPDGLYPITISATPPGGSESFDLVGEVTVDTT